MTPFEWSLLSQRQQQQPAYNAVVDDSFHILRKDGNEHDSIN